MMVDAKQAGASGEDFHEPWTVVEGTAFEAATIEDRLKMCVLSMMGGDLNEEQETPTAKRIVACVNFCQNIPTEMLEQIVRRRLEMNLLSAISASAAAAEHEELGAGAK